jgi:hypothetical protein
MNNEQRTKVWVDHFQTRLTIRMVAYLLLSLFVLVNFLFGWRMWQEGTADPVGQFVRTLSDYLPVWICLLALAPVMVLDAIGFTHRLVGPLVRFRQVFQDVANGVPVRPIKLRSGDHLGELRDDVNRMLESLHRRGLPVLKPVDPTEEESKQRTSA